MAERDIDKKCNPIFRNEHNNTSTPVDHSGTVVMQIYKYKTGVFKIEAELFIEHDYYFKQHDHGR